MMLVNLILKFKYFLIIFFAILLIICLPYVARYNQLFKDILSFCGF